VISKHGNYDITGHKLLDRIYSEVTILEKTKI